MKTMIASLLLISNLAAASSGQSAREHYSKKVAGAYVQLITTQAEARQAGVVCGYYKSSMIEQVQTLMQEAYEEPLRSQVLKKLTDSTAVTQELGDSLTYKAALGMVSSQFPFKGLETALPGVSFFAPAPGVYGNMGSVTFLDQESVKRSELVFEGDSMQPVWKHSFASYHIESSDRTVFLIIGGERYILRSMIQSESHFLPWNNQWNLVPADRPEANPHMEGLVDIKSECEA